MRKLVGIFLLITLVITPSRTLPSKRGAPSYCETRDEKTLISFNFTKLSTSFGDGFISDETSGDSIRLRLCEPLRRKCNDEAGYRICLTKHGREIGIGRQPPDPIDPNSGKLAFLFRSDETEEGDKYFVHVLMKCDNEDNYNSQPMIWPVKADDHSYHIVWKTKAACGPEDVINCTATGSGGEHYDLTPLMLRSANYAKTINRTRKASIILNVCHSVVFEHDVRCPLHTGACWRETGHDQEFRYRSLGGVRDSPKFDNDTKELILTYDTGELCKMNNAKGHVDTIITFSCDYNAIDTLPEYLGGEEECVHRFGWKTVAACSTESLKNRSLSTAGLCKVTNPITNFEYDLHTLMNRNFRSKASNGMEFSFEVCSSVSDSSCPPGTGACMTNNKTSTGLANANLTWSQGGPYLNYTNGDECGNNQRRYTLMGFFCGVDKQTSEPIIMEHENCSLIIHWNTQLVCDSRVKCETKDGEISLRSLIKQTDNYVVKANDTQFHINICRPLIPKPYLTCLHGSSACHVTPQANGQFSNEISLGYPDTNPWLDEKKNVLLRYAGGSPCLEDSKIKISTNLTFLCNYTANIGAPVYKYYRNCTHVFEWPSSIVCESAVGRWEKACAIVNPSLSHKVDLTPLARKKVYSVKGRSGEAYGISLCAGQSYCKGSAVCKGNAGYGTPSSVTFDYNRNVIKLKFSNGVMCKTGSSESEVHLICDEASGIGEPTPLWEDRCLVIFEWKTSVVCVNRKADNASIDGEPKIEETTENIDAGATGHVGTNIGIAFFIAGCIALIIYLWNSDRRTRLRLFCKSLTSRRDNGRAQYTKVDATEEAELLLDVGETNRCVTDSDSDDELLNA